MVVNVDEVEIHAIESASPLLQWLYTVLNIADSLPASRYRHSKNVKINATVRNLVTHLSPTDKVRFIHYIQ